MTIIGLIPARGGSKGIPRKNLASLGGKPLIAWTIEAALGATRLDRVILSTEDDEIGAAGTQLGIEWLRRPRDLAADETPMLPVMLHALDHAPADILVLLQPTSPLRRSRHIDEAVALLLESGADSVVSVVEVPHQFSPASVLAMDRSGALESFIAGPQILRRQDKPRVFARNGPAVLALRTATLRDGTLYGPRTLGYVMDSADSHDIDGPEDLWLAEQLLKRRGDAP